MHKSGWLVAPAAFFLLLNFSFVTNKNLFLSRLIYLLFLILLFQFLRQFNLRPILPAAVGVFALLIFSYGIMQKFFLFPIYLKAIAVKNSFYSQAMISRIASGRIFSIFVLPSLYALICVVLLLFIFHFLFKGKGAMRVVWGYLIILGTFNLVLTQSFGGIIYLSAGLLFYLFFSGIVNIKYLAPTIMVLSLIFFIITGLRFSEAKALKPLKLRMTNWAQASRIIRVNPIVGIGLGNYEIQVPAFTRAGESQSIFAHNFFLQWIAETGILFSLLLLILLFVMMKKTIKEFFRRENIIFSAIVLTVLLYNLIDIGIYLTGAGIAITIALSQIYWSDKKKFRLPLLLITPLLLFMLVNFFADNAQKKADINLSQNNSLAAEKLYKKCLTINPQSYRSLMGLALIANSRREFDNAENYLRRVLVLHPGYGYANHLLSRLMIQKVRYMDALYHAEISKVKNPFNPAYKRWHEHIKTTINRQLPTTRY